MAIETITAVAGKTLSTSRPGESEFNRSTLVPLRVADNVSFVRPGLYELRVSLRGATLAGRYDLQDLLRTGSFG